MPPTKRTITLTIIGDETAPAIKKITVNGDKAKDPTVSETNYIYDTVLPNASELLVGAEGTLINYYVEIDERDRKLSKNEKKVYMPVSESEKEIGVKLYKEATDSNSAVAAGLILKRLAQDYGIILTVDGKAPTAKNDGSYETGLS